MSDDTPVVGRIEFSLGGRKYEMSAPDLVVIDPGEAITHDEIEAVGAASAHFPNGKMSALLDSLYRKLSRRLVK